LYWIFRSRSLSKHHFVPSGGPSHEENDRALLKKVPHDAVADFEPITKLGTITLALVANPSVSANLKELIANAKTNPGKLTFAKIEPE
jgi:tripartite-type tricarboxylate transporter receptor subunit TctC